MNSLLLKASTLSLLLLSLTSCPFAEFDRSCKDEYGEFLYLEVPISTSPSQDTFRVGDTLWVEANISKDVAVKDRPLTIYLDSFEFRTSLIVSEISGEEEDFLVDVEIIEIVGNVTPRSLPTLFKYTMEYQLSEDAYRFKAALIFNVPGRYYVRFDSGASFILGHYNHPALLCEGRQREEVDIHYTNPSTTYSNYENILTASGVPYLQTGSFERRQSIGAHAFIVTE